MRILHVVRQYAPGIGGLENYVARLAGEQQRLGHDVRVLTLDRLFDGDGTILPATETLDGVPITRMAWRGSHRYPLVPSLLARLGDAELIHVHGVDSLIDALAAMRMVHRRPLILSTHGGFFHTGFAAPIKRVFFATVTRASLLGVRAVLASSVQDRDRFAQLWPARTHLVENGVDIDKFRNFARPGARTIISFGRIAPNKQPIRLLRWFAALLAVEGDWRLIVAGRPMGVTIETLTHEAARLGIAARTEFHETPNDATLGALIARSDVYASASSYEGFGLAAVEAVAAGLYPVLSDIPAFRRTIERLGLGTLTDFADPTGIPAVLRDVNRFSASRPTPADIGERVAPFAWRQVAGDIEQIADMVLGRRTRRIGALTVAVRTREAALAEVLAAVAQRRALLVAFANAHLVNMASGDPAFAASLADALILNDGVGVNIASRLLYGTGFPANLNGTDFVPALLAALPRPTRVVLVGSRAAVVEQAGRRFMAAYPQVEVVGTYHGFFEASDEAMIGDRIAAARPDLILAGMGNPRQERWARDNLVRLGVPILCVGALFDFTAGAFRRAPPWVRRARAEWLYRLVQEPRRMAGRYFLGNLLFLSRALGQWVVGQRGGGSTGLHG